MAKLSREEVIDLYKIPNSLSIEEIYKYCGYFLCPATIKRYIEYGRKNNLITQEDEIALEEKLQARENLKTEQEKLLMDIILREFMENKSFIRISSQLQKVHDINITPEIVRYKIKKHFGEEKYYEIMSERKKVKMKKKENKNLER